MRKLFVLAGVTGLLGTAAAAVGQTNLLLDPTFELPTPLTCSTKSDWVSPNWLTWTSNPAWGIKCRRNAETHNPPCPRDPAGDADQTRGSISWGEPTSHRMYQTVTVTPGTTYALSGWWSGGNATADPMTFRAELRSGSPGSPPSFDGLPLIASYGGTVPGYDNQYAWEWFSCSGAAISNQMTVIIYTSAVSWGIHTIHVDGLMLNEGSCAKPPQIDDPVVTGIPNPVPGYAARGDVVDVVITGGNFETGKMSVVLQQGATEIEAAPVTVQSATELTARFDLTGAALGTWSVIVRNQDCIEEAELLGGFRVYLPGPSLHNSSFELPTAAAACPAVRINGWPDDWTFAQRDAYGGDFGYRDEDGMVGGGRESEIYLPTCPPPDGAHYVSTRTTQGGGTMEMYQTLICTPDTTYNLSGMFAGNGGNRVRLALLRGEQSGSVAAEKTIHGADVGETGSYDWRFEYVQAEIEVDLLTVRYQVTNQAAGWKVAYADALVLEPVVGAVSVAGVSPEILEDDVVTPVTITGSGFQASTDPVQVLFEGPGRRQVWANQVQVTSDTTLTCDVNMAGMPMGQGGWMVLVKRGGAIGTLALDNLVIAHSTFLNGGWQDPSAPFACSMLGGVASGWEFRVVTDLLPPAMPAWLNRNDTAFAPICPAPAPGAEHYGSLSSNHINTTAYAYQVVHVKAGNTYRFGGLFEGPGGDDAQVGISLVDGGDCTAVPLQATTWSKPIDPQDPSAWPNWVERNVTATAISDVMTIVWSLTPIGTDSWTTRIVNADAMTFGRSCNTPPQDSDGDQDVDLVDFGQFQACFNGPNRQYKIQSPPEAKAKCECVDGDRDNDVDLVDFGAFQSCFNGPNRPAKCLAG